MLEHGGDRDDEEAGEEAQSDETDDEAGQADASQAETERQKSARVMAEANATSLVDYQRAASRLRMGNTAAAPVPASSGFFGWIKNLFGGAPAAPAAAAGCASRPRRS